MKIIFLIYFVLNFSLPIHYAPAQTNSKVFLLEADVVKFLGDAAVIKDTALCRALSELAEIKDTSAASLINVFLEKLDNHNLIAEKYYPGIGGNRVQAVEYLTAVINDALSGDIRILMNRIGDYGIKGALAEKSGSLRIKVELLSDKKEETLKRLMTTTGRLSFNMIMDKDSVNALLSDIDKSLYGSDPESGNHRFTSLINFELASGLNWLPVKKDTIEYACGLLDRDDVKKIIPAGIKYFWSEKLINTMTESYRLLYFAKSRPELSGDDIADAVCSINPNDGNSYANITLNNEGAAAWEKITEANIGKECAVIFDGKVFWSPKIMTKITGGIISIGGFSGADDAKILTLLVKSGALSMPLKIVLE